MSAPPRIIVTLIPARLDRLPWTRFHTLIVVGLGITWVLDGLEVTLFGAVSAVLQEPETLPSRREQIGLLASSYLVGAVLGSLVFGWLTDRYGRRLFFFVTLAVYLAGVAALRLLLGFLELCRSSASSPAPASAANMPPSIRPSTN